ncbi:MAG: serine/threonine-protein kinase [Polyangiaceae bacterium]
MMSPEDSNTQQRPQQAPAELDLQADAYKLGGKYQLLAELGRGGMATVYLAVATGPSTSFRKLTVIKRLREDVQNDPEFLQMFLEEARLAAQLSHPNVIHTYEVGEEGGRYYIAMEYLDSVSLQSIIGRLKYDGPFTFAHYLRVILDVLEGLAYAHNLNDLDGSPLNLVHRDISPHNILTTFDGQTKLVDFGIAKAANSMVETRTGVIKGKVTYMAPEQAFSAHIDCTADLYAIGVMLWEAIAQRRRWKGLSSGHVLQKLAMKEMPEPAGAAARGLPPELDEICNRALAHEPADRFRSADEMAAALRKVFNKLEEQPTPRQVGLVIAKEFEKERSQRKAVIEERLRIAASEAVTSLPLVPPPPSSVTEASGAPMSVPMRTMPSATSLVAPATEKNRSSAFLLAGAGVLLAVGGVYGFLRKSDASTLPVTPSASTTIVTAPPTATTPQTVTVRLRLLPASQRVELDGVLLPAGTDVLTMPEDRKTHEVIGKAPGYREKSKQFTTNDASVTLDLEALPRFVGGPAPTSRPTAAAAPQNPHPPATPTAAPAPTKPGLDRGDPFSK